MKVIRIYLSGSIQKGVGDAVKKSVWTDEDIATLRETLEGVANLSLMNPASRSDDLSDHVSVLGRDLLQVYISDLILVDARDRKGLGVGAEMQFAKDYGIPVISVSPPNSQYRKDILEYLGQVVHDWTHPFVGGLSDYIADSVREAAEYIRDHFPFEGGTIKDRDYLRSSMLHYVNTQFKIDTEMYSLANEDPELLNRIELLKGGNG